MMTTTTAVLANAVETAIAIVDEQGRLTAMTTITGEDGDRAHPAL